MITDPGEHRLLLQVNDRTRSYMAYVPQLALQGQAAPVVLNFHGGGGNARGYMQYTRMNEHADREGYVVVYPDGNGKRDDKFLSWNAGSCCGYAYQHNADDVGFVGALLEDLSQQVLFDASRVYATGISNGAMMAYRLASELADKVAAVAAVAGGAVFDRIQAARAVPVMHIHSIDDPRALFNGGLGPSFPMTNTRVNHPNIENVVRMWVEHNNCAASPDIEPAIIKQGSAGTHTAIRHVYRSLSTFGDDKGAEVVFWKLTGAGHVWPGGLQDYMESLLGDSTDVIDANTEIWNFFSGYTL